MEKSLTAAVVALSADTGRTLAVARQVGALERGALLATLRKVSIARWAVVVKRLADDPSYVDEMSTADIDQARSLCHDLLVEVAA